MFLICSNMPVMDRFAPTISSPAIGLDTTALAEAILAAPAWARVGITAPTESIREAAAQEMALQIGKLVTTDESEPDPRQIPLPL